MAKGRKRKSGKRYPSGKLVQPSKAETQREVTATVIETRQRHYGVTARQAKDKRIGSAIGRLAFAGKISAEQLAAAELYGDLMARNRAVMGLPGANPVSAAWLIMEQGIIGRSTIEPDPEYVTKIRKRAAKAIVILRAADSDAPAASDRLPSVLVHKIVCLEADASGWCPGDLRNLNHGLEALISLFRIKTNSSLPDILS